MVWDVEDGDHNLAFKCKGKNMSKNSCERVEEL